MEDKTVAILRFRSRGYLERFRGKTARIGQQICYFVNGDAEYWTLDFMNVASFGRTKDLSFLNVEIRHLINHEETCTATKHHLHIYV